MSRSVTPNPEVERKWLQAKESLLQEVGEEREVLCHVPGWEPVNLSMGLRWLQISIYEGFAVSQQVAREPNLAVVRFSISEPD